MATPVAGTTELTFTSDVERAQRAIAEFEKVAAKYGDPYRTQSLYFIASNRLVLDRQKGLTELEQLSKSDITEVATLSKFALAQANESDGKFDQAAQLYTEIAKLNSPTVSAETANLRLAKVYEKQGKKKEAADLLFNMVDAARKAKGQDNQPIPTSAAAREAADELQKLDPDRYAQLPPETPPLLAGRTDCGKGGAGKIVTGRNRALPVVGECS
jgi:tetratricopeptide (TPR) repeat protein